MRQLKDKYGFEAVAYENKEPDFSTLAEYSVKIDDFNGQRSGKEGTYSKANDMLAEQTNMSRSEIEQYIKDNNLTWHECGDRTTMQLIPAEINAAYKHMGGIGIQKSLDKYKEFNQERFGDKTLELQYDNPYEGYVVDNQEIKNATNAIKKQMRRG